MICVLPNWCRAQTPYHLNRFDSGAQLIRHDSSDLLAGFHAEPGVGQQGPVALARGGLSILSYFGGWSDPKRIIRREFQESNLNAAQWQRCFQKTNHHTTLCPVSNVYTRIRDTPSRQVGVSHASRITRGCERLSASPSIIKPRKPNLDFVPSSVIGGILPVHHLSESHCLYLRFSGIAMFSSSQVLQFERCESSPRDVQSRAIESSYEIFVSATLFGIVS
jgi:hypothetical protein